MRRTRRIEPAAPVLRVEGSVPQGPRSCQGDRNSESPHVGMRRLSDVIITCLAYEPLASIRVGSYPLDSPGQLKADP